MTLIDIDFLIIREGTRTCLFGNVVARYTNASNAEQSSNRTSFVKIADQIYFKSYLLICS